MTTASRLRIGIVGLGRLGRRHAQNLAQRVPAAELVAACSPVADELAWAKDTLGVRNLYVDYAALLGETGVDAVFLVTRCEPTSMCSAKNRSRSILANAGASKPRRRSIRSSR